jgi:hypothetical protein
VLRSKISVFVDLWTTHTRLSEQAAECVQLRSAIDEAIDLLDSADPGAAARARERLVASQRGRLGQQAGR